MEEVDAIIDKSGSTVCAEIQGYVRYEYILPFCLYFDINNFYRLIAV